MNQQSKEIIFARHLGCKISTFGYENAILTIEVLYNWIDRDISLELTPLSKITDEECSDIANLDSIDHNIGIIGQWNGKDNQQLYKIVKNKIDNIIEYVEAYQYLQQLGYALPQLIIEDGEVIIYTVEQLIELGIFKLI